jgi:hypothetical protein
MGAGYSVAATPLSSAVPASLMSTNFEGMTWSA